MFLTLDERFGRADADEPRVSGCCFRIESEPSNKLRVCGCML